MEKKYFGNCKFCREVDADQKKFVKRLQEAIAIPSVSGQPERLLRFTYGPVAKNGITIILSAIFGSLFLVSKIKL